VAAGTSSSMTSGNSSGFSAYISVSVCVDIYLICSFFV